MRKNNLTPNKGLSLSQAQSISNLCNQRASEIAKVLVFVNNYSKSVDVDGKTHEIVKGKPLPTNVVLFLKEKAELHACQAFLMENMKAKDAMLKSIKNEQLDYSGITVPKRPLGELMNVNDELLSEVNEEYGWGQLTPSEYNEYLEAEAYASHIGQFIHKNGILDGLRIELPEIPAIEWMTIKDGVKSPVMINVHHKPEDLLELHEELAALHRQYEQRVNYFKAKVKNLTTERNAEIAKYNADLQNEAEAFNNKLNSEYDTAFKAYTEKTKSVKAEFEKTRQARIKEIASMRIEIDPRFQKVIDTFLNQLPAQE